MRIGIITPAFNAASTLGNTIRSVLAQTHADWRMVIVDDGSSDDTWDVGSASDDPRIAIARQTKQGVSAARNTGLQTLPAEAYLFLDADDCLTSDALATMCAALKAAPWASAAVAAYRFIDGSGPATGRRAAIGGDLVEALVRRNRFVNGGHVLVRAEAIKLAGGFDPTLHYGEDWEFWVRIALTGEFVAATQRAPVLLVRQRADGAYARLASDPTSFEPCMAAIFRNPRLKDRVGSGRLTLLERAARAENAWVVGREQIRHRRTAEGIRWLATSVRLWPTMRRLLLLATVPLVLHLPTAFRGALRPYAEPLPAG